MSGWKDNDYISTPLIMRTVNYLNYLVKFSAYSYTPLDYSLQNDIVCCVSLLGQIVITHLMFLSLAKAHSEVNSPHMID